MSMLEIIKQKDVNITVVDDIMGKGKTSWAIQYINECNEFEKKFIYITPFLDEVTRVKTNVTNRKFHEPTNKNNKGSKMEHLRRLLGEGKDIICTHALFEEIDTDILEYIYYNGYTLIMDEVMNVVEKKTLGVKDFDMLVKQGFITIDEENNNKVIWNKDEEDYNETFRWLKNLALTDNLFLHTRYKQDNKIVLMVWQFPITIFKAMQEVYILTYLFDGQLQKYYYDMFDVEYKYKSVNKIDDKYKLEDYNDRESDKERFKDLIDIYEGSYNEIGVEKYSLSSSWFSNVKNKTNIGILKRKCETYIRTINTKSNFNMWTCYKENKSSLSGKGYSKGFVEVNARATNEYSHKETCMYLVNRFLNPIDAGYFQDKGIKVNEDIWALSELLQWIWRSRIRNNQPINLFIPSKRMRELLNKWLNNEM